MRLPVAIAVAVWLFASPAAFAWNKPGHMVSAAIAYEVLKREDPKALAAALTLLRQHPQYEERFVAILESRPPEDRDLYLFMVAARWADDVRGNRQYHRGPWHYINHPFKPDSQPDTVQAKPPAEPNLVTAFAENLAIVNGDAATPAEKAVALCWLFHLVGDAHQPLHAVALFTAEYPDGDRGGNLAFVRVRAGGQVINLHALWDGLIIGRQGFQDVRNEATRLQLRPEFARERLPELKVGDFEAWVAASFELAKRVVYRDGQVTGSAVRDAATVLPDGYTDEAKTAAERQIVLAGHRVADLLKETTLHRPRGGGR